MDWMNTKPTPASTPSGHSMLWLTLGLESSQPFSILSSSKIQTSTQGSSHAKFPSCLDTKAYFLPLL